MKIKVTWQSTCDICGINAGPGEVICENCKGKLIMSKGGKQ